MDNFLALELVKRGGIRQGTKLESFFKGIDISGCPLARARGIFHVEEAKRLKTGEIIFETKDSTGLNQRIIANDVIAIEGMDPDRVANMLGFDIEDGKVVVLKKRRSSKDADLEDDEDE